MIRKWRSNASPRQSDHDQNWRSTENEGDEMTERNVAHEKDMEEVRDLVQSFSDMDHPQLSAARREDLLDYCREEGKKLWDQVLPEFEVFMERRKKEDLDPELKKEYRAKVREQMEDRGLLKKWKLGKDRIRHCAFKIEAYEKTKDDVTREIRLLEIRGVQVNHNYN